MGSINWRDVLISNVNEATSKRRASEMLQSPSEGYADVQFVYATGPSPAKSVTVKTKDLTTYLQPRLEASDKVCTRGISSNHLFVVTVSG